MSRDAVVVVPGIMGSELADPVTGRVLWGLSDPRWYVSAWTSGHALRALMPPGDPERAARLRATRLLRAPAFAPVLRGVEPYRELLAGVRKVVADPAAVLEFPYDWRLSIADTAHTLAEAAGAHLDRWRAHPRGSRDAKLVLVAHSMGGLVAHYFAAVLGGEAVTRAIVTLGTPFYGSVKAVEMLATGAGGLPLPRRRLRDLAVTLPGVYDLLPTYRSVDEGTGARSLTPSDVTSLGADGRLASSSAELHQRLARTGGPGGYCVVGVGQPTTQSLRIRDGVAELSHYVCERSGEMSWGRVDRQGDSTVYRDAAYRPGSRPTFLPQSHGMLARSPEAIAHVKSVITQRPLGPPLGVSADDATIGMEVPDVVSVGQPFLVAVSGDDPAATQCRVRDANTQAVEMIPTVALRDGRLSAELSLPRPGIFRVEVERGSFHPVSQLVLAVPGTYLIGVVANA